MLKYSKSIEKYIKYLNTDHQELKTTGCHTILEKCDFYLEDLLFIV